MSLRKRYASKPRLQDMPVYTSWRHDSHLFGKGRRNTATQQLVRWRRLKLGRCRSYMDSLKRSLAKKSLRTEDYSEKSLEIEMVEMGVTEDWACH